MAADRNRRLVALVALSLLVGVVGCDEDGGTVTGSPTATLSGTIALGPDRGIDFANGDAVSPGNWGNSDVFATANGDSLKLTAGGPTPTKNRPVDWFRTAGNVHKKYDSLADVPNTKPTSATYPSLLHAEVGHAFSVQTMEGDYVKGRVTAASAVSVTIEYVSVP